VIDPELNETRILVGAIERPPVLLPGAPEVLERHASLADAVRNVAPHLSDESHALHVAALRRAIGLALGQKELVR
jgi:aerobic carbon-monoxide dehydrogenase medium subunit